MDADPPTLSRRLVARGTDPQPAAVGSIWADIGSTLVCLYFPPLRQLAMWKNVLPMAAVRKGFTCIKESSE
jgi:hypothetical protein